jgi:guanine deaminase
MKTIVHGQIFDFFKNPSDCSKPEESYRFFCDGGLVAENGYIKEVGYFNSMKSKYPDYRIIDYSDYLVMPGFIDTHIHYPQTEIIGSYGRQLVDWLNDYTFAVEKNFNDREYAQNIARLFIKELLRNGTTTSMTYATQSAVSTDAIFEAASEYNMRFIAGKVLMNRNAPSVICDTVESARKDCEYLINRWHHEGRNLYAITPRFAITSDMEQLKMAGELHKKYPDTFIQTHLSENPAEVKTTLELFSDCSDYLEVYEKAGLVDDYSFFAHCIHLSQSERQRLKSAGSVVVHCPTSNLFLGSGLFPLKKTIESGIKTCIATDVGAGTSFSLLRTLGDAYKIAQLQGYTINSLESFYCVTYGAAKALKLDDKIGSFRVGNEADFIVVDYRVPDIQKHRMNYLVNQGKWNVENMLFGLQTMGDDRNIRATYIMGVRVYSSDKQE